MAKESAQEKADREAAEAVAAQEKADQEKAEADKAQAAADKEKADAEKAKADEPKGKGPRKDVIRNMKKEGPVRVAGVQLDARGSGKGDSQKLSPKQLGDKNFMQTIRRNVASKLIELGE